MMPIYNLHIEGTTEGIMIEPFLFISFIENGFKHAIDQFFCKTIYLYNAESKSRTRLY